MNRPTGVAVTVIERLRSIKDGIEDKGFATALSGLRRWHVDLDLNHVPREVVENTSDLLRKAAVYLDLPPHRPDVAVRAIQQALTLWQPLGRVAPGRAGLELGSDDTLDQTPT